MGWEIRTEAPKPESPHPQVYTGNMKAWGAGLAVAALCSAQLPGDLQRTFDLAERRIVRLPPREFPELPGTVTLELERRGCRVPQEAFTKTPHNVVRGEFVKPGQTDWAVLCSRGGASTILVFWNGSGTAPAEIAKAEDRNYLQGITPSQIGFSRGIRAVGREFIMRHYQAYGGPAPPTVEHQGIDDAFIEKASVTHYFHNGKWLQLTGAD